ncbi:unnamed protein product [Moneuplotes crassus]|uniref:Uncharacterized protein n=1 Tax=Euplotes crassus TaxID=5936 RepID=A0AAD1Y3T5_EUPCR|nr:unnamed protein product [Moneuplotes crassus]
MPESCHSSLISQISEQFSSFPSTQCRECACCSCLLSVNIMEHFSCNLMTNFLTKNCQTSSCGRLRNICTKKMTKRYSVPSFLNICNPKILRYSKHVRGTCLEMSKNPGSQRTLCFEIKKFTILTRCNYYTQEQTK